MKKTSFSFLITVVLPDRVGILRDITGVIFVNGGNLTDLHQMVRGGLFVLNCVAEFAGEMEADRLKAAILSDLPEKDASVIVRASGAETDAPTIAGERYVAAVSGPDRPGRVHMITELFARHGVNVEDWRHDLSDRNNALTIGLVTIPHEQNIPTLSAELSASLAPYGMAASLRHENIFRATNEVGPIGELFNKPNHLGDF